MPDLPPRGPQVAADEYLLRAIVHPGWWDADGGRPSSAIFSHAKFSAFIESLLPADHALHRLPEGSDKFPNGSGVIRFNCGVSRELAFDPRHEPEDGEQAHANVYCDLNSNQRKKRIRKLLDSPSTTVTKKPEVARLLAASQP